jgi:UDP-N-acetylmuramoyl-tripeptide--D-alanyl-D-alanine ligase
MQPTWNHYKNWLSALLIKDLPEHSTPPTGKRILIDSRKITAGDWFLALKGHRFDGHSFIEEAVENGAYGFITERFIDKFSTPPQITVSSTEKALQQIAAGWRMLHQKTKIIALTGSVGKTTTKEMVKLILQEVGKTLATQGNNNNEIGLPLTLLQLEVEHNFAILELGARQPHDIKKLTAICKPDIVTCTNIGKAHLEIFGSQEVLTQTKLEIFSSMPSSLWLINLDDPKIAPQQETAQVPPMTFGQSKKATLCLLKTEWLPDSRMQLQLSYKNEIFSIILNSANKAYPENALAASAIALCAGAKTSDIQNGLKKFFGGARRFEIHKKSNWTLIDDTYNASGMKMGIESATNIPRTGPLILIIGDTLELGPESKSFHTDIGELCSATKPDLLITVGSLSKTISDIAQKSQCNTMHVSQVDNLLTKDFLASIQKQSLIYVKGSRSIQLDKLTDYLLSDSP